MGGPGSGPQKGGGVAETRTLRKTSRKLKKQPGTVIPKGRFSGRGQFKKLISTARSYRKGGRLK